MGFLFSALSELYYLAVTYSADCKSAYHFITPAPKITFRDYFIHYVCVLIRLAWLRNHFRGLGHGYTLLLVLGIRGPELAISCIA